MATTFSVSMDLSKPAGLAALDALLVSRSYWCGFAFSHCDSTLFKAIGAAPDAAKYPNVARYYAHIAALIAEGASASKTSACGTATAGGKVAAAGAGDDSDDDDSDDDLFGDDDKPKAAKKKPVAVAKKAVAKKPEKVAKTQLVFEVKPEEAETDLKAVEAAIRAITKDGLLWGEEFGTVPVGYGINKLVVQCVVEDEKVSVDDLEETVQDLEGVQSTDMVAMNKM